MVEQEEKGTYVEVAIYVTPLHELEGIPDNWFTRNKTIVTITTLGSFGYTEMPAA